MKQVNWNEVEEKQIGDYKTLEPGGYICQILRVTDKPDKEYLEIEFDIVEGEYKDFYTDLNSSINKWCGTINQFYTKNSEPYFKGFLTAVERSNPNFKIDEFNGDEQKLVGKRVGILFRREHYNDKSTGEPKSIVKGCFFRDIFAIKDGKFYIPKDKYSDDYKSQGKFNLNDPDLIPLDDDCPFTL